MATSTCTSPALGIYDPSTAPGGFVRFKDILKFFESRLDAAPVFRRRLVTVPFDLDRPYWIEDAARRRRVPRAPRRAAAAGRLAPALHPGGAHPLAAARPQQAAVGGLRDRGARQHPRHPAGQLRLLHQVPPRARSTARAGTEVLKAIHSSSPEESAERGCGRARRIRDREPLAARALRARLRQQPAARAAGWRASRSRPRRASPASAPATWAS